MKNIAEKRFNEVVAEMIANSWGIDCSHEFNQGSQGELNKIAFTKGKEVKVVWLTEEHYWEESKNIIKLEVKSYKNLPEYETIVWYNEGEVESVETFIRVSEHSHGSKLYVVSEEEAEAMLAKKKERRNIRWNNEPKKERPYMINKANEILHNSGIYGTKRDKVVHVFKNNHGGYDFHTEKKHVYFFNTKGFSKWY